MRLPLLVCALVLSIQGWCASVTPSQHTARAITSGHQTTMIGWVVITYLTVLIWWTITAKNSLDKILKDVLQGIAQYS